MPLTRLSHLGERPNQNWGGKANRMRLAGKQEGDIATAMAEAARWNLTLLRFHDAPEEDWPETRVEATYAVVADRLEDEFKASWPAMMERARALAAETGDWREKPEEGYRQAAREAEGGARNSPHK